MFTDSTSCTTVKSPGHHQMKKPNEKHENQKSTKNNNDLNGNATQKQIANVSKKLVKKKSNKGPIDQFVRMEYAFKRKPSQSPEGGNKKDTKISREANQEEDGP